MNHVILFCEAVAWLNAIHLYRHGGYTTNSRKSISLPSWQVPCILGPLNLTIVLDGFDDPCVMSMEKLDWLLKRQGHKLQTSFTYDDIVNSNKVITGMEIIDCPPVRDR